jgi:hypothetical protein
LLNWYEAKFGRPRQVIAAGKFDGRPGLRLQLVHITRPAADNAIVTRTIKTAVTTAAGRARLALANALAGIPGWYRAALPPPATVGGQITQQAQFDQNVIEPLAGPTGRAILEAEAAPTPVRQPGSTATACPRARRRYPSSPCTARATAQSALRPSTGMPYRSGPSACLRQIFVRRGGHCSFTASEEVVTLRGLQTRLNTGRWPALNPARLNAGALGLPPAYQQVIDWVSGPTTVTPAFVTDQPGRLLRPSPHTRY